MTTGACRGWEPSLKERHTMEASQAHHGCTATLFGCKEKAETFLLHRREPRLLACSAIVLLARLGSLV